MTEPVEPVLEPRHGPVRRFLGLALDLIYPPTCPACGAAFGEGEEGPLCGPCMARLDWIGRQGCARCAQPMPGAASNDAVCVSCATNPPPFASAVAAARLHGDLREIILRFKFLPQPALARPLGKLLARAVRERGMDFRDAVVVPLPLAPGRRRKRGFDQARHLARRLCRELGLPRPVLAVCRLRHTETQSTLDRAQRLRNVAGAFAVRDPARIKGRRVVLVDDVLTTGATAGEAARVLLAAGAASVTVAAVGRG